LEKTEQLLGKDRMIIWKRQKCCDWPSGEIKTSDNGKCG
jgi:hypothetical protein